MSHKNNNKTNTGTQSKNTRIQNSKLKNQRMQKHKLKYIYYRGKLKKMTNPRGSWRPYLKTSKQNPQKTTTITTIFSIILFFTWQIGVNSFRLYYTPCVTALIWTPIFFPCFMSLCSSALQEIRQNEEETHLYKLRKSQKVSVVCKSKREANLKNGTMETNITAARRSPLSSTLQWGSKVWHQIKNLSWT